MPEHTAITRRIDGRFVASIQLQGKRRYVYGRSEGEVRRKLAELRRQTAVVGSVPTPGRRSVNDLLDAWLDACRPTLKPKTVVGYEDTARWYIRPTLGQVKLSRLEPAHVQGLYSLLASRRLIRTPAQAHAVLHRACRLGVLWGWLGRNPCDHVLPPRYQAPRKKVWTAADTSRFLQGVAGDRYGPLFTFVALTGVRIGEALALRWEDVEGETAIIRRTVTRLHGEWVVTAPKTGAGERTLALSPTVMVALRTETTRQNERRLRAGRNWQDRGLVFSSIRGGFVYRAEVARALRLACDRLGLRRLTPHGLRHLSASLLLAESVPLPNVSQRLGHANPAITARLYSHVVRTDVQAADALERLLADQGVGGIRVEGATSMGSP
jgi:integrase